MKKIKRSMSYTELPEQDKNLLTNIAKQYLSEWSEDSDEAVREIAENTDVADLAEILYNDEDFDYIFGANAQDLVEPYPEYIESVYESDVNGDGDTDVVATDTDDNGKEDTAVVAAESKEEAKDGLKEAINIVKEDVDTPDVDSTGTAEVEVEEEDDDSDSKRSRKALGYYIASDEKEKDVEDTCSDASLKNIMSSLLNYKY